MAEGQKITIGTILKIKGDEIVGILKRNLEKYDAIASKNLYQSIRPDIKIFGDEFELQITADGAAYWKNVNKGRKPGKMPPIQPIQKWIAHKGIPIRQMVQSKPLKRKNKLSLSQRVKNANKSMAYLIARKIAKHGTKPKPFKDDLMDDKAYWVKMSEDISQVLGKEYVINIKEIFS